jgi:hypothetical protein
MLSETTFGGRVELSSPLHRQSHKEFVRNLCIFDICPGAPYSGRSGIDAVEKAIET